MFAKKLRAIVPIVALVALGACSDTTGPGAPELAEVLNDNIDDPSQEVAQGTITKKKLPLDQQDDRQN